MRNFLDRTWPETRSNKPQNIPTGWYAVRGSRTGEICRMLQSEEKVAVLLQEANPTWAQMELPVLHIATSDRVYLFELSKVAEEPDFQSLIKEGPLKITFDAMDLSVFFRQFGLELSLPFCLLTANKLLSNGIDSDNKDLDGLIKSVLGRTLPKSQGSLKARIQSQANETAILLDLETNILAQLEESEIEQVMMQEMEVIPILTSMMVTGVPFTRELWLEQVQELEKEKATLEESRPPIFEGISMLSHRDVSNTLEENGFSPDDDELEPVWASLMRQVEQKLSCYGRNFLKHVGKHTGRLHPNWELLGSVTGRITASEPAVQNLPKNGQFRRCIRASEGYSLIMGDFSQIELHVAAVLSGSEALLQAFQDKLDIHRFTAAQVNNIPPEEVTTEQRQAAKALNFGLIFGMGVESLIKYAADGYNVQMSVEEAKSFKQSFFSTYPGLAKWHQQLLEEGRQNLASYTPLGRRRLYHGQEEDLFAKLLNFPVQGTAADGMKRALVYLHEGLRKYEDDAKIIMIVHDEVVLEVKNELIDEVRAILEDSMLKGMRQIVRNVPIEVQISVGKNWSFK